MGFRQIKRKIVEAIRIGPVQHEARRSIDTKNYLLNGSLSPEALIDLLKNARGNEHREDRHHADGSVTVHIVKTRGWYIKFYFLEPDAWFLRVHPIDGK